MMRRVLRDRLRKTALVTLFDEQTFRGVLWESDREALVLRNAELLTDGGSVAVDGEVVLLMAEISYIQIP